jgi:peroxiredoxin
MKIFGKYKLQILLSPVIILLGIFSAVEVEKFDTLREVPIDNVGQVTFDNRPFPQADFLDYKNETNPTYDLGRGKVLVLYILTKCRGCQLESEMIADSDFIKNSNLRVFGIANENEDSIDEFIKNHKVNFPILADNEGLIRDKLDITFFPANFLLNNGIIEKSWVGMPQSITELEEKLKGSLPK